MSLGSTTGGAGGGGRVGIAQNRGRRLGGFGFDLGLHSGFERHVFGRRTHRYVQVEHPVGGRARRRIGRGRHLGGRRPGRHLRHVEVEQRGLATRE